MALIEVAGITRDIGLVVFDKDGTLIDFDRLWLGKCARGLDATLAAVGSPPGLYDLMCRSLGIDPANRSIVPESPLAVAPIASIVIVCATVLYQHGLLWHEAETIAARAFLPPLRSPPQADELHPVGDVAGLFRRLIAAGVKVAVLTTDDRLGTTATLPMLGIEHLVTGFVCGDDAFPSKPEPDGLLHLAQLAAVAPERVMMVGDSAGDMAAGLAAGAGLRVGVLSGTGKRETLATRAHVVVPDIHAIRVVG